MDDRRLTVIVVPHGDAETRTLEMTYGRLKLLVGAVAVLLLAFAAMVSLWWFVAAQAARVPGLEREVARLEEERAQVAELARTLQEVEEQYERVRQMLGADATPEAGEPILPPLREGRDEEGLPISHENAPSAWPLAEPGYITQQVSGVGRERHPGLDIAVPQDSWVRAAGSGTVLDAGRDEVYGLYVLVDHGLGIESMYGHASQLFVTPGDPVEQHEVIALSGSTGRSTAPHLHFEIRRNGEPVDPLTYVQKP